MNKQEQIDAKAKKPIEVGDVVFIKIPYVVTTIKEIGRGKKKESVTETIDKIFNTEGKVLEIKDDKYHIELPSTSIPFDLDDKIKTFYTAKTNKIGVVDLKYLSPTFDECGANPFVKERTRISFYNKDIGSLLFSAGYGRRSNDFNEVDEEYKHRVNFNPYIIDADGNKQFYQRDLVWSLEQKQLLIESIYNNIEIGKILYRYNSWARLTKQEIEDGVGYNFDCVDGKQRFFAILHFLQNKYPDMHGNYWDDLSGQAHSRFLNYGNLSYGEMSEDATDEDVVDNFLRLNHTGVPMSIEHIQFVQSIKM